MDMLEKAARAAHECLSDANIMAYLDMPHDTAEKTARAVIQAIREPVKIADQVDYKFYPSCADALTTFQEVIDAILSEGE